MFVRVVEDLESPRFFRTGKSWKKGSGPGKFWEYVKLKGNVWQTVRRINIEILGKKGVNHEF